MKLSHRRPEIVARESGTDRANGGWLRRFVRLLVSPETISIMAILLSVLSLAMMVWEKPLVNWLRKMRAETPAITSSQQTQPQSQKQ
jgi:hypothetical protein